ncbi:hypothetical protein K474DRAFT_1657268 [Panus rudis PR-1116 ss-1]|nr:hypothetical protein K474DRAFT_1657268 [Panus rudis PR-1116 ss-1]
MPFGLGKSPLAAITLDHVLTGETCEPISLSDFETYLEYKEYSIENLHFLVWYQDYRQRFSQLPRELQELSPSPSSSLDNNLQSASQVPLPSIGKTERRLTASKVNYENYVLNQKPSLATLVGESQGPCSPVSPTFSTSGYSSASYHGQSQPNSPLLRATSGSGTFASSHLDPDRQPFRQECLCVLKTFLRDGSSRELSLDGRVREMIVRDLTWTTHPDVFLSAYEQTYDTLSTISLPHFLSLSTTNINRSKAYFWYYVGTFNFALALVITLITVLAVEDYTERAPTVIGRDYWHGGQSRLAKARAWRLLALPCFVFGVMQFYSGAKGFCSEVWGRGRIQLRPWELDLVQFDGTYPDDASDVSSRTNAHDAADGIPSPTPAQDKSNIVSQSSSTEHRLAPWESMDIPAFSLDENKDDALAGVQPFFRFPPPPPPEQLVFCSTSPISTSSPSGSFTQGAPHQGTNDLSTAPPHSEEQPRNPFDFPVHFPRSRNPDSSKGGAERQTPIFGPERLVLDRRIAAVHKQALTDMLWVGGFWGILFTALILSLPGRRW